MKRRLTPKANGRTIYRGLLIEHSSEDEASFVTVQRVFDSRKCASLQFIDETGCFSDDDETALTPKEKQAIDEITKAYVDANLY